MSQVLWGVEPTPLSAWGETALASGPVETGRKPFALRSEASVPLGRIWELSWGLRIALGFLVVLLWTGATSLASSSAPPTGPSVSSPMPGSIVVPTAPPEPAPTAGGSAPGTANLPRQPLVITYDYGPGPQPVP